MSMELFNKEELYNTEITKWQNILCPKNCSDVTIQKVLSSIKNGDYKSQIDDIRKWKQSGDEEMAKNIKMKLPAVTFAGLFDNGRKSINCVQYNYLLVLDFDHLSNSEMDRVQNILSQDPYVIAFWRSPSGDGWKGIVPLSNVNVDYDNYNLFHLNAFIQLEDHFQSVYNIPLDKSGKDITRLCFLSSDADIVIKEQCQKFPISQDNDIAKNAQSATNCFTLEEAKELQIDFNTVSDWNHLNKIIVKRPESHNKFRPKMEKIVKFLEKKQLSITYNYEQWVCVAFAIATTFHYDYGQKIFMRLCKLDVDKFDEDKCDKLLFNAYKNNRGQRTFKTILYYAKQKGWIIKS